jgi:putative transposase
MEYRVYIPPGNKSLTTKASKSSTAAYILFYHFVFRTKWNKKTFEDDRGASALIEVFIGICENKGYQLLGASVLQDHVHIIVSLKPDIAPSDAARYLKGVSATEFHKKFGGSGSLWSSGYSVEAVGRKNVHQVLSYIARQDEHHGTLPG